MFRLISLKKKHIVFQIFFKPISFFQYFYRIVLFQGGKKRNSFCWELGTWEPEVKSIQLREEIKGNYHYPF